MFNPITKQHQDGPYTIMINERQRLILTLLLNGHYAGAKCPSFKEEAGLLRQMFAELPRVTKKDEQQVIQGFCL